MERGEPGGALGETGPRKGGHYRVELGEFTKTHYSRYYIPILMCTFLNSQNSTQSQMHGCIFLGRRSVTLTGLCVPPKVKSHCYRCTYLYTDS